MGDIYFERLQAGAAAWESTNPLEGGDAELIIGLLAPREGEADYVAPAASTADHTLSVAGGEFRIRVYRPAEEAPERPLLIWCHGGSFFSGDLGMPESDAVAREICARADAVVIAVEYRLALGIHFPALHDDVVAAFDWAVANADDLGIDAARITVGGASAGGNLAAGAALALRDRGGITPVSTLLLYPLLHPVLPQPSAELAPKIARLSPMLQPSADLVETVVENYIGMRASEAPVYAMPGVADDLTGFPSTLIVNSEYDGMRASAEAFASQLRSNGTGVTEIIEPGVYHGHLGRGGGAPFLHSVQVMADWIRGADEPYELRSAPPAASDIPSGRNTMRRAIVTGGASGLGAATAERLRAEGVDVITVDRAAGADETVDITDVDAVAALAGRVGHVDILINSAGIVGPNTPLVSTTPDDWRRTFEVNVLGTVAMMQAFTPGMVERGWGRIVNFASMAGKDGNPNLSVYSATKAAVIALTKSAGKELATTGVIVNAIAPAVIATPMNDSTAPDVLAHITSLIPMKRVGEAREVAELVAWLSSDKVSFSTGAVYDISGGRATY